MPSVITAVYENGLLRPEQKLDLPPHTRVRLTVEAVDARAGADDEAWSELERMWADRPVDSGGDRLTRDQLHERR